MIKISDRHDPSIYNYTVTFAALYIFNGFLYLHILVTNSDVKIYLYTFNLLLNVLMLNVLLNVLNVLMLG